MFGAIAPLTHGITIASGKKLRSTFIFLSLIIFATLLASYPLKRARESYLSCLAAAMATCLFAYTFPAWQHGNDENDEKKDAICWPFLR